MTSLVVLLFSSTNRSRTNFKRVAQDLQITDLCLTTEARHTRHPAFPDLFTPFQDLPAGADRYASSTLLFIPTEIWYTDSEGSPK